MKKFLATPLLALTLQAAAPQFFIQLSDPQMGMFAKDADTQQDEANLAFAIANINRLKPAFVVITGDLVNKAGDANQIQRYRILLSNIDPAIPIYNVAGNHDVGNEPTPPQLQAYRKAIGRDYYTFQSGSLRGIVLNSSLIGSPKNAPEDAARQEQWLQTELQRAKTDGVARVMVFQHIPYFLEAADEPDQYFNIPTATRRRYLDWFHQFGVRQIFAGHYHRNSYGKDGDIEMITNGPVGMPLGKEQSGMRIVRVTDAGVESRYYGLGNIPHAVDPGAPLP
jgi:3',5'-cyclic AMP phosphodiesterase CpdA